MDLNCDMGESYGAWTLGQDEALLEIVTSANIACGFHGGDPPAVERTLRLALARGVAVGAHPSYPDLQGFGRRSMRMSPPEVESLVLYQVSALYGMAAACGGRLHHVKLHGALYNDAARDPETAGAVFPAVMRLDPELRLYVLAGSRMAAAARAEGAAVVEEAFADRRYNPDGTLQDRGIGGALITSADEAARQAVSIACSGTLTAHDGSTVPVLADTLCIHGDNPVAVEIARAVRSALESVGIPVQSP